MSQRDIIRKVIARNPEPTPSWELQKANTPWGWLGTSADRVARKMAEDGELERTRRGKYVYYSLPEPSHQRRML